ncbi:hypothetical protein H1R17_07620 [Flavobacterium sp. xlx-214]|uniref:hypothetical protein n=1 Tax=unclassified Flavobacterium TaxID=196869 RepID=UPI0013D76A01|nr:MULTISPECIES: hypothetical protein [unclassified Flavobacterium]MBA5792312.1 hypothetical protein [Flavobacterium sp. xlx-221]QMI82371.1 hypothetical protein H1R17_07620 [Flavobacterium sp. xlx-214]
MKKVIFSLKSIALVAMASMAMVSCGDDEKPAPPPPAPDTELTENFIQVNNDQEEIVYSIYAVHTDGAGNDAPIKEYTLKDGTVVIAFEFISHNGTSAGAVNSATANTFTTILTKVNVDATGDDRYEMPFGEDESKTLLGGFSTKMNDTSYTYANGASFKPTALTYATKEAAGNMTYTLEGTDKDDTSITLKTNLNGEIAGLYSLNASQSKGLNTVSKNVQLSKRSSL